MKVSMKVQISGTRDGDPWPAVGSELIVSDAEGADLCSQGYAEPVAEPQSERTEKRPAKRTEKRA